MPFIGEHRVNWVMAQYRSYRRRNNAGSVLLLISLALVLSIGSIAPFIPTEARTTADLVIGAIGLVLFGAASRLFNQGLEYYLPRTEDRLLCFLKPAVESLRGYESYGKEDDKKKALKTLRKVASVLDEWNPGNLDFLKNGRIGKTLSDLQRNFRDGLLASLKDADKTKARNILVVLTNMDGVLEQTNSIDEEHLNIWNRMLSEYPSPKPQPFKPIWRRLPAKRSHLSIISMLVVVPIATGWAGFALLHVPVEAAYLGAIAMFGAMVGLLVFLLSRKRPN